jgi:hypothetical protein
MVDPEVTSIEVYQRIDEKFVRLGVFERGESFHSIVLNALIHVDALL